MAFLQNKEPKIFFDEWLKGHVYKNINWFQKYFEMDRFFVAIIFIGSHYLENLDWWLVDGVF